MKISFTLDQTLLHITTPSPWKPTITILTPTTSLKNPCLPPKSWRIPADPRRSNMESSSRKPKVTKFKQAEFEEGKEEAAAAKFNDDDDDHMPDVVKETLIKRLLVCAGVPLVFGLLLLKGFSIVKEQNIWEIPRWIPYLTLFITFGSSTLGIPYAALSTSWEADKNEGSFLGFEEFQKNWVDMWNDVDE